MKNVMLKKTAFEEFVSTRDRLKDLMMDLLSTTTEVDQQRLNILTVTDWQSMTKFVEDHRIGPILYWRINHSHQNLSLPEFFFEDIKSRYHANTFKNLAVERELILIGETLYQANIPFLALKGAFLAWYAYPEIGLRPLRDIDLLVSKDRALKAFDCLMKAGARRIKGHESLPALVLEDPCCKHLPPILSSHGTVSIDIHWLIFHHYMSLKDVWDLTEDKLLWKRCFNAKLNQTVLLFLSPTDQLVHLIEHAFRGHLLDNGPLILSDIAFLMEKHEIDWDLFNHLINEGELEQAARLALGMVYRDYGIGSFDWLIKHQAEPSLIETTIVNAPRLMLRDYDARKDINFFNEVFESMEINQPHALLMNLFFTPKINVALKFNLDIKSPYLYFYYPIMWAQKFFTGVPRLLSLLVLKSFKEENVQIGKLLAWLQKRDES